MQITTVSVYILRKWWRELCKDKEVNASKIKLVIVLTLKALGVNWGLIYYNTNSSTSAASSGA